MGLKGDMKMTITKKTARWLPMTRGFLLWPAVS